MFCPSVELFMSHFMLNFLVLHVFHTVAQKGEVTYFTYSCNFLNISTEAVHRRCSTFCLTESSWSVKGNGSSRLGNRSVWLRVLGGNCKQIAAKILSLTKQLNKTDIPCLLIKSTAWTSSVREANWQEYDSITRFISQNCGQKQSQKEAQHVRKAL